jgi:hypothetical protein
MMRQKGKEIMMYAQLACHGANLLSIEFGVYVVCVGCCMELAI